METANIVYSVRNEVIQQIHVLIQRLFGLNLILLKSRAEKSCFCLFVKVTNICTPKAREDEFIEIQSETGTAFQRWSVRHMTMLQQVCRPDSGAHK